MTDLQSAAQVLAGHDTAWEMFRTGAQLAAWVEARQRGVGVDASDAIADAALASVRALLRDWAAEPDEAVADHEAERYRQGEDFTP